VVASTPLVRLNGWAYLCRMEQTQQHGTATVPGIALVLAVFAGICLGVGDVMGFRSDAAESVYICAFLAGWSFLSGAALLGGGTAISLGYRALSQRPVTGLEGVLIALTLVLVMILVTTQPLWGSGSGSA
jgi:hypothetical protein